MDAGLEDLLRFFSVDDFGSHKAWKINELALLPIGQKSDNSGQSTNDSNCNSHSLREPNAAVSEVSRLVLLQPGVFRSGLFKDRTVIGVFPERKEIAVGGLGLIVVSRRMPCAA